MTGLTFHVPGLKILAWQR